MVSCVSVRHEILFCTCFTEFHATNGYVIACFNKVKEVVPIQSSSTIEMQKEEIPPKKRKRSGLIDLYQDLYFPLNGKNNLIQKLCTRHFQ